MADKRIQQTKKIFVETEYDNIILVNPNEIYDADNQPTPRLVDHEDLIFYANLETFIIPRTKLAIGDDLNSPVMNTTIATVFGGDEDLKINFLKPKGKTYFDTSWSDQLTGFESRLGLGKNQKREEVVTADGIPRFKNTISNYEDTQLLGIKSIQVNIKGTGVPEVSIEMTDIQGRSLFEQGENSIYSAFFNFPYPLFYLTLKGYYGKAIRYRLSLLSFNARFDASTGNYDISLKLVGKFTALLFDTPLQYAITAPKMYNTQITVKDPSNNTVKSSSTYKGRQKLDEVYEIYKRKGLIPSNFEHLSIEEFIDRANNYTVKQMNYLKEQGDFTKLNDIQSYRDNLSGLKESVYTNSIDKFLDNTSFYVSGNLIYYPYKKEIDEQTQKDYETKIQERITYYTNELNANETFGTGKEYEIVLGIKDKKEVIKQNFDIVGWLNNQSDVLKTYYYRTGQQIDITTAEGAAQLEKFKLDEEKNKELFRKVINERGEIVEENPVYYVFGDHRVADGTYEPNSFLDKIDKAEKTLQTNEEVIEKDLAFVLANRTLKNPSEGGLGFKPTIRNIFAIIFAGADAFYRLMEDTHQDAWNVRENPKRLNAVIPPEKSFSVDGRNSIQTGGLLNKDNVVYPWPLYFNKEKQTDGRDLYVIQYPGDASVIKQTKAFDYTIWPEIGFVESYLKGTVEKAKPVTANVFNNTADYSSYVSANAIEFPYNTPPYQDPSSIAFMYEIFERTYLSSFYSNLNTLQATNNQIDSFFAELESKNIQLAVEGNIELNQKLKNLSFTYDTFVAYLKELSNKGNGEYWQNYIRSIFNTENISNSIQTTDDIYSIETISSRSIEISSDIKLKNKIEQFLGGSNGSDALSNFNTYPFSVLPWIQQNLFKGNEIESIENYNSTSDFIYLDDKKTIARINENTFNSPITLLTNNKGLENYNQPYVSTINAPINSSLLLKDYFINRTKDEYYLTESLLNYGNTYSGNVNSVQTTSLLNTPYFSNAIIDGVTKKINNVENPYVTLGYLFLNSLPLITTKDMIISDVGEYDYLAATFKKFSAIHQVPYSWVLKYGSIWHRYKRFVNDNVDILDSVWTNFNASTNYDPTTSDPTLQYVVPDYSGNPLNIFLQKTENLPAPSLQTKDFMFVGFYPKLIDSVNYFVTNKNLFTGYTASAFQFAYNDKNFRIGKNNQSTTNLNFGFDTNNTNRSFQKTNLYCYSLETGTTEQNYILYPSMGGIPIDQSAFECLNSNNQLSEEFFNNTSLYNGTVRSLWVSSNFGYYNNNLIQKPKPTEYIKSKIIGGQGKLSFDLNSTDDTFEYANIEEIFSIFTPELLDKFEEKFLGFCSDKPVAQDLTLNGEIIDPTYFDTNGVPNLKQKRLQTVLSSLFKINKNDITLSSEDTDGKTLAERQVLNFVKTVTEFLNFDCIIKLGNPSRFNRLLFNSFSTLTEYVPEFGKLVFDPYVFGSLPGDGTNVTLLESVTNNSDAWKTLKLYLGFSSIPGVDYGVQVQPAFPSVPSPTQTPNILNGSIQLKFLGDSATIIPIDGNPTANVAYFNIQKVDGTYQVFQIIGDSNVTTSKIGTKKFYQQGVDFNDPNSPMVAYQLLKDTSTNDTNLIFNLNNNVAGNYTMVLEYFPNGPSVPSTKITLNAQISNSAQITQLINNQVQPQPNVVPLPNTPTSYVSDFFINMNVAFTSDNIKQLHPLIRLFVTQKIQDPTLDKSKFTTFINNLLTTQKTFHSQVLNQTLKNLNNNLKEVTVTDDITTSAVSGNVGKLTLYNTLKAFNDKWIAGSDLKYVTLFEDFLFLDRANSDIGDTYVVDIDKIIKRMDISINPDMNLMTLVSNILSDNQFMFFAMPAYINFYGIQQSVRNGQPIDIDIPNSLFGTYLEVDYTKSSPKFLCLYMGNPSEYPKPKENSFIRFDDDSFDLRMPDNPLRVSDPNRDYSKTNRVVGFSVDFGIQNQNIFRNLDLDMSEMKNTSESFKVFADIGSSVAGDKVAQQSVSMYSIYKSRSYSCTVESMGCVMIQPTMYFVLRHVPLFYGPYWIYEVNHSISENQFQTKFKGTRIPKYSLPNIDNLVINVNSKIIQSYKETIQKEKTTPEAETQVNIDPVVDTTKTSTDKCLEKTQYTTLPFVEVNKKLFTQEEIVPIIKAATTDVRLRALLFGILVTRPINSYDQAASTIEITNLNMYEISTQTKFKGSMDQYLKEQICVEIQGSPRVLASFTSNETSSQFMVSFYQEFLSLIEDLKNLNTDIDANKSYGKALAQICLTTWDTPVAFGNPNASPPIPPLTALEIKNRVTESTVSEVIQRYDALVTIFTNFYEGFVTNQL
jgi:hypothetical protein